MYLELPTPPRLQLSVSGIYRYGEAYAGRYFISVGCNRNVEHPWRVLGTVPRTPLGPWLWIPDSGFWILNSEFGFRVSGKGD